MCAASKRAAYTDRTRSHSHAHPLTRLKCMCTCSRARTHARTHARIHTLHTLNSLNIDSGTLHASNSNPPPAFAYLAPAPIQHPPSPIQHPPSNIQHPPSPIQHPLSPIQHPPESIQHPPSPIQHPPSSIQHPFSPIQHPPSPNQHPPAPIQYLVAAMSMPQDFASHARVPRERECHGERVHGRMNRASTTRVRIRPGRLLQRLSGAGMYRSPPEKNGPAPPALRRRPSAGHSLFFPPSLPPSLCLYIYISLHQYPPPCLPACLPR